MYWGDANKVLSLALMGTGYKLIIQSSSGYIITVKIRG